MIGIFDSGVGGLTVVRAVQQRLPHADIVYLGDTARLPYGNKSARTVQSYSRACRDFLLEKRAELIVVACNTASALALNHIHSDSPVPVIGAVQPGARAARSQTQSNRIGVLGTRATVASKAYQHALATLAPQAVVHAIACPLFVPLAEEGWSDDPITRSVANRYLCELLARDPNIDTLVLGCTHYPLLAHAIAAEARGITGRDIAVVDSASAMAEAAAPQYTVPSGSGGLDCYVTDVSRLPELGERFLGQPVTAELVDL